jgi:hypothetical protein
MNASNCISEFLSEMLEWENWFYLIQKEKLYNENRAYSLEIKADSKNKLQKILKKWLTESAYLEIGEAKLDSLGVGRPRIYAQEVCLDSEFVKNITYVITKNSESPCLYFRYSLESNEDRWKISGLHSRYDESEWEKRNSI